MAYKVIQGFNHLPVLNDYSLDNALRDFMLDQSNGYFTIVEPTGIRAGLVKTAVKEFNNRHYLCFQRLPTGGSTSTAAGFSVSTEAHYSSVHATKLEKTGTWLFGWKGVTGPGTPASANEPLLLAVLRYSNASTEQVDFLEYSADYNSVFAVQVVWDTPASNAAITVWRDGTIIHDSLYEDLDNLGIHFGSFGAQFFDNNGDDDLYFGFTDFYFIHNADDDPNPTLRPGSVNVEPLYLDVQEDGEDWTTSDEAKTPVEVLNETLLPDGTNALNPFVTSDPRGGMVRFSIAAPSSDSDITHIDIKGLVSTEGEGQTAFQSTISYRGFTDEVRTHTPNSTMTPVTLSDFSKTNTPDIWKPEDIGEIEIALNSYSFSRPNKVPFDTGPGPSQLIQGSPELGYFGTVDGVFNRHDLADAFGISQHSGDNHVFLKYIRKGKVCFIPALAAGLAVTGDMLYGKGLVYGDDTMGPEGSPQDTLQDARITIEGYTFKVRLMSSWEIDTPPPSASPWPELGINVDTGLRFSELPPGAGGELVDVLTTLMAINPFTEEQWGEMPADYFGLNVWSVDGGRFLLQEMSVEEGDGTRLITATDRPSLSTVIRLFSIAVNSSLPSYGWFPVLELTDE